MTGGNDHKPAIPRRYLLLIAAAVWIGAGAMMNALAYGWLSSAALVPGVAIAGAGLVLALVIHHFGFLRVVDRNLGRIAKLGERPCAFAFISWKSYLLVAVMIGLGVIVRHLPIPKLALAPLYIGIGAALVLSSVRYLRYFAGWGNTLR